MSDYEKYISQGSDIYLSEYEKYISQGSYIYLSDYEKYISQGSDIYLCAPHFLISWVDGKTTGTVGSPAKSQTDRLAKS